ncbi:uncharacterized protein LOC126259971 isoform X2 [Schistocerca nitens]|uniref:uncharacterized protein LOC126259971 isoform X2 n=1 Tax=Schistocerca nitens TaxID=7011 RepID=UPI002117FDF6|nr:uncharacterized protein LOC126259971 isoform X2 [Schistocerca nitens]
MLKLTNKISEDNLSMNKKLDTIISADSKIEELQSPKYNVNICLKPLVNGADSLESGYNKVSEFVQENIGTANGKQTDLAADKHKHHIVVNVLCIPTHTSKTTVGDRENGADECCNNNVLNLMAINLNATLRSANKTLMHPEILHQ